AILIQNFISLRGYSVVVTQPFRGRKASLFAYQGVEGRRAAFNKKNNRIKFRIVFNDFTFPTAPTLQYQSCCGFEYSAH
ncbi:MAG: hypothetical protein U5L74_10675, partial [Ideonella sp.]|nr:hypothetical protein [Ideonella sp.]